MLQWTVLAITAAMFVVETGADVLAGSTSVEADAPDLLGDAAGAVRAALDRPVPVWG